MRLLIISHDRVGARMAGPGIRAWELARALARDSALDVTLAAPAPPDLAPQGFACAAFTLGDPASLAALTDRADAIFANGHLIAHHPELAEAAAPLMLDLYDPTPLENLELFRAAPPEQREDQAARDAALLRAQLLAGDAFVCATERQRDLYVGALLALGRVTPPLADADPLLRGLIDVVSFGLPVDPPAHTEQALRGRLPGLDAATKLLLWTGGLWDWMDPLTLIRAMPAIRERVPEARLVLLAGRHPGGAATMEMPDKARGLAAELGVIGETVQFYDEWVPYERRGDFLLEADLLVSLGRPGLESAYAAVRSRFLDHLWAGRASLVSAGDAAAELVARFGLGSVVPPGDVQATAEAAVSLLTNDHQRAEAAGRARALAADYTWERVAEPIRRWLAAPHRTRPDKQITTGVAKTTIAHQGQGDDERPATDDRQQTTDYRMDDTARNDAVARLDGLWKIEPRPLGSSVPGVGRAKELANSLTRWYVQGIVEQQNAFNAALVQAIQALAANDDRRHSELSLHINAFSSQMRQALALTQKRVEQVAQRVEEHARHLADIDDAQTAMAETIAELRELAETVAELRELAADLTRGEDPR